MISLPGYQIREKLFESRNSFVFRAFKEDPGIPVVIKIMKGEYPEPDRIIRFKREYEIIKELDIDGVIKAYSFENFENNCFIVTEDFGGESIKKIIERKSLTIDEFLRLSVKISDILGRLHQKGIIHKNINSTNIVWNQVTDELKIIDFGIATPLSREYAAIQTPGEFEGTLSYISPEQTGRMNRMLDYRTDMYSLGVTFYEMLTGQLPFTFDDPVEVVHSHIARDAVSPELIRIHWKKKELSDVAVISRIIMKLMSKNADSRYQSAFGLKNDLEICQYQLYSTGRIRSFEIAERDYSESFLIPQKLYGREAEISLLMESFNSVCQGGRELFLVTGYAGIGKSALVHELHKPVMERGGYFITGKFEQSRFNVPYSSLIQAFQQLVKLILTENERKIAFWRDKILDSVGSNCQVLIDVIPEIELVTGSQPPVPDLPSRESQNRFNHLFRNFIRTLAQPNHPLTLFLDDFQWIDGPSLNLIRMFMTDPETDCILLLGAYRESDLDRDNQLHEVVDEIERAGTKVTRMMLSNLDYANVNELLADTLKSTPEKTDELARLCMRKTHGNPFFLKQFLKTIYENHLFEFDNTEMSWKWTIRKIEMMKVTENVVDLMVDKFKSLTDKSQSALKIAACIGTQFDLNTLSYVSGQTARDIAADLWEPLQEELLMIAGNLYKPDFSDYENADIRYRFSHDRIQNAIYSLIDPAECRQNHLRIGRTLLNRTDKSDLDDKILSITNQLNEGEELITERAEIDELAALNYRAGMKTKTANAYETAWKYFSQGIKLLGPECWGRDYDLSLKMHTDGAETSFLAGNYAEMETLIEEVLRMSTNMLDKIRISDILIQSYIARALFPEALRKAIEILNQLNIKIPQNPSRLHVIMSLIRTNLMLLGKSNKDLLDLRQMNDPVNLAAMRILMVTASSAYRGYTLMAVLMALKMTRLSVRYGNSPYSPYGYCLFGIVMLGVAHRINLGYRFGKLSIDLIGGQKNFEYHAKIIVLFNFFLRHWKEKLSVTVDSLHNAIETGLESGDLEFASYSMMYSNVHSLFSGGNLDSVIKEMDRNISVIKKLKQERTLNNLRIHRQLALNLNGQAKERTRLIGAEINEDLILPVLLNMNDTPSTGAYYTNKTFLNYLFGNYYIAFRTSCEAEKYSEALMGLVYRPLLTYYTSLSFIAYYPSLPWNSKLLITRKIIFNEFSMRRWAKHAPDNHLHKFYLLKAERLRISGRTTRAADYYEKAIRQAHKSGYIHDEALGNELAARLYIQKGNQTVARSYMTEARYLYYRWGAKAKVDYIEEEYFHLLFPGTRGNNDMHGIPGANLTISESIQPEKFDIETVQKAAQTISGEIHLERLLEKLLKILIANAGAEKGFIILKEGEAFFVEGEAFANREKVEIMHHIPLGEKMDLSQVIIYYVIRTKAIITLTDASEDDIFSHDEYITSMKPKSLFCMPLVYQNKLSGILYLENNLLAGAFTNERVEMLKLLSGQIVIAVENARLYRNLEQYNKTLEENVARRTAEISNKNIELNHQKEELRIALENLKQSQYQLIQAEKMASLGQLVAGIAHEINNPVNFISAGVDSLHTNLNDIRQVIDIYKRITPLNVNEVLSDVDKLKDKIDYHQAISEISRLLESIKNGTKRTTEIIRGLRTFSRMDEDVVRTADIHEGLESTLVLLHSRYQQGIEIVRKYDELPLIECYPGQLNQVFMNLLSNAIDAVGEKGTITVSTRRMEGAVQISIRDTGKGIPEILLERIFEPFFTTKDVGKGTGLGLSISHGIIEKHSGTIEVISEECKGTEFIITLPVTQKHEQYN